MTPGSDVHPLSPPLRILPDLQKGALLTELPQTEMLPFWSPPTISKIPGNGLLRFTNRCLHRETPISRAFFYTFPSKSPINEPLPPCSPTGSPWRKKPHLQRQWFIHSLTSVRVPNKEPSHEKQEKYLVTIHGAPRGRKAYIQCGVAWFPKQ